MSMSCSSGRACQPGGVPGLRVQHLHTMKISLPNPVGSIVAVELVLEPSPLLSPYIHTCNPVEDVTIKNGYGLNLGNSTVALTLREPRPYSVRSQTTRS